LDQKDPVNRAYIATGQNPPDVIKQAAEKRAATTFEQGQATATPEGRRQTAVAKGYDVKDPAVQAWILTGQNLPNTGALNKAGLSPVWGMRKNPQTGQDEPVMMQTTGEGKAVETQLPPGVTATNKPMVIQTPTHDILMDPYSHQVISVVPKDVAGAAAQKVIGTGQGKAQLDLPKAEADAKIVTDTIDKALADHPGKSWSVGTMFKDVPALPGSQTANYRAILDQLDSQTFLEAYNSLRGGGAISNYEDKRASAAKARLSRAQSVDEFNTALREYKEIVQSGVERMRTLAGAPAQQSQPQSTGRPPLDTIFK
jgi:hypothetical protein